MFHDRDIKKVYFVSPQWECQMSNWWTLLLCWGLPCRGSCAWWDSIVTQTLMMTFLRRDVTCTLYSDGHLSQWWLQKTAGLTDKRNIKPRPGWNLFNQCCSWYQAVQWLDSFMTSKEGRLLTLWHNWSLALWMLAKYFGHYKNIAVITSPTLSPFISCKILIWDSQNYTTIALVSKTSGHLTWYAKIYFVVWERSANDFVNLTLS